MSKTILALTDYSGVSENAVHYALKMAAHLKATVVLMHVFHVPVPDSSMPAPISYSELKELNKKTLLKFYNKVKKKCSAPVPVELLVEEGFTVATVLSLLKKRKIDLVVMGVTGAGKSALWGSTATSVLKKTKCPVLIVPRDVQFKKPQKIVLANDLNSRIPKRTTASIRSLVNAFKAEALVFDMLLPSERMFGYVASGAGITEKFSDTKQSLDLEEGENVLESINTFVQKKNADWLVMIPHTYTFWESLFHRSRTKQMAFWTGIPLLSVHD